MPLGASLRLHLSLASRACLRVKTGASARRRAQGGSISGAQGGETMTDWERVSADLAQGLPLGVFAVGGVAARLAGAAGLLSGVVAALVAALSGLCFAEASPRLWRLHHTSAYEYIYRTGGEAAAFLIGWTLTLEKVAWAALVSRAIGQNVDTLSGHWISNFTATHLPQIGLFNSQIDPIALLVVSASILIVIITITDRPVNHSDVTQPGHSPRPANSAPVGWTKPARLGVNASIIAFLLFAGAVGVHHFRWENWAWSTGSVASHGWRGVLSTAGAVYFIYTPSPATRRSSLYLPGGRSGRLTFIFSSLSAIFLSLLALLGVTSLVTLLDPYWSGIRPSDWSDDGRPGAVFPEAYCAASLSWMAYCLAAAAILVLVPSVGLELVEGAESVARLVRDGLLMPGGSAPLRPSSSEEQHRHETREYNLVYEDLPDPVRRRNSEHSRERYSSKIGFHDGVAEPGPRDDDDDVTASFDRRDVTLDADYSTIGIGYDVMAQPEIPPENSDFDVGRAVVNYIITHQNHEHSGNDDVTRPPRACYWLPGIATFLGALLLDVTSLAQLTSLARLTTQLAAAVCLLSELHRPRGRRWGVRGGRGGTGGANSTSERDDELFGRECGLEPRSNSDASEASAVMLSENADLSEIVQPETVLSTNADLELGAWNNQKAPGLTGGISDGFVAEWDTRSHIGDGNPFLKGESERSKPSIGLSVDGNSFADYIACDQNIYEDTSSGIGVVCGVAQCRPDILPSSSFQQGGISYPTISHDGSFVSDSETAAGTLTLSRLTLSVSDASSRPFPANFHQSASSFKSNAAVLIPNSATGGIGAEEEIRRIASADCVNGFHDNAGGISACRFDSFVAGEDAGEPRDPGNRCHDDNDGCYANETGTSTSSSDIDDIVDEYRDEQNIQRGVFSAGFSCDDADDDVALLNPRCPTPASHRRLIRCLIAVVVTTLTLSFTLSLRASCGGRILTDNINDTHWLQGNSSFKKSQLHEASLHGKQFYTDSPFHLKINQSATSEIFSTDRKSTRFAQSFTVKMEQLSLTGAASGGHPALLGALVAACLVVLLACCVLLLRLPRNDVGVSLAGGRRGPCPIRWREVALTPGAQMGFVVVGCTLVGFCCWQSVVLFAIWLGGGLLIYLTYGMRHSVESAARYSVQRRPNCRWLDHRQSHHGRPNSRPNIRPHGRPNCRPDGRDSRGAPPRWEPLSSSNYLHQTEAV